MKPMHGLSSAALAALLAAGLAAASAAQVRSERKCDGQAWNTPYCQDKLLAEVARSYGVRVTDLEIRTNPNRKLEMCRFIGHDPRVYHACTGLRDEATGGLSGGSGGAQ